VQCRCFFTPQRWRLARADSVAAQNAKQDGYVHMQCACLPVHNYVLLPAGSAGRRLLQAVAAAPAAPAAPGAADDGGEDDDEEDDEGDYAEGGLHHNFYQGTLLLVLSSV
jgi:hypothetical protein